MRLTSAALLAAAMFGRTVLAADRYWDGGGNAANNNVITGAGLGGSGVWDAATLTWWDGASGTDQAWNDAANDKAVFWGPTPGSITLDGPRAASGLVFKTNGYGLLGNSLTLTGPATMHADAGVNATVSPILSGSSGLTKTGDGTVFINNINNDFTGPVTVNGGTLAFSHESLTPNDKAQFGRVPASNGTAGSGITLNGATLRAELFQGGQGPPPPATLGPTRRIDLSAAGGTLDVVGGVILGLGADGGGSLASGGIYTSAGGHLTKTGAGRVAVSKNTNNAPHSFVGLTVLQGTWSIFQTDAVVGGTGGNPVGAQPLASPPNATEARKYAIVLDYNGLGGGAVFRFRGLTDPGGTARTDIVIGNNRPILIGPGGGTIDTNGSATSHGGVGGVANSGPYSGILALGAPGTGTLTKANDGEFFHGGDASYGALVINRGSWAVANELQLGNGSAASPAINVTLDTAGSGLQPATLRIVQANVNMAAAHALTVGPGGGTICTDNSGVVWNGPLVGAGTLTKGGYVGLVASPFIGNSAGNGTLTLSTDSPAFSGAVVVRTGTLIAASAIKLGDDVSPGNTLTLDGGAFRAAAGYSMNRAVSIGPGGGTIDTLANDLTIAGGVSGSGSLTKVGAGTLTLTGNATYGGGTNVQAGTLQVKRMHENNAVTITGGMLRVLESSPTLPSHPSGDNAFVSRPTSLTIANNGAPLGSRVYNGKLDLTNNDMIIDYDGASPRAEIEDMIRAGFNGGNWQGLGITSSTAAANSNFIVAVADNATLATKFGTAQNGPLFSGQDVDLTTVLVKFTHRVDLDLDGLVTPNDASVFGTNYTPGAAARWAIGDMDYDGIFTPNDASIFGTAYNTALASVPEPAELGVIGLLSLGLARRRRAR